MNKTKKRIAVLMTMLFPLVGCNGVNNEGKNNSHIEENTEKENDNVSNEDENVNNDKIENEDKENKVVNGDETVNNDKVEGEDKEENNNKKENIEPTGTFKLTIIDNYNWIIDKPSERDSYFAPGAEIVLHCYIFYDVDLGMFANGEFICSQTNVEINNEDLWEFRYTMTDCDTILEFYTGSYSRHISYGK